MRTVVLASAIVALAAVGCRDPMAPDYAVVLSLTDSVEARRSQNEASLSVQLKLENHDDRNVYFDNCGHAIQRREGHEWRVVWSSGCPPTDISDGLYPGESRLFTFIARTAISSSQWPAVGAVGEYRVVLWLHAVPRNSSGFSLQLLRAEDRTSPVFTVREVVIVL